MIRDEETYMDFLYRDIFIDQIFPYGKSRMQTTDFIELLKNEQFEFLFDARKLKDKFMNYASNLSTTKTLNVKEKSIVDHSKMVSEEIEVQLYNEPKDIIKTLSYSSRDNSVEI